METIRDRIRHYFHQGPANNPPNSGNRRNSGSSRPHRRRAQSSVDSPPGSHLQAPSSPSHPHHSPGNQRPLSTGDYESMSHQLPPDLLSLDAPMPPPVDSLDQLPYSPEEDTPAISRPVIPQPGESRPPTKFRSDETVQVRLLPYNPYFPTIEKEFKNGMVVPIGRYQRHGHHDDPLNDGIYFRSTVVSRRHAQISFHGGEFYIRDVKSLGGTFLNSTRLSPAGQESRPYKLQHGDILQFGVDYRPDSRTGQVRNKDKCVEVRLEFPKLAVDKPREKPERWIPAQHQYTECCICLSKLYKKQALFIAPCTHSFHYRCIAPLLRGNGFQCPMCRQTGDLHASVYSLDSEGDEEEVEGGDDAAVVSPVPEEVTAEDEEPLPLFSTTVQEIPVPVVAAVQPRSYSPEHKLQRQSPVPAPLAISPQPRSPHGNGDYSVPDSLLQSPLSPSTKVNSAKESEQFPVVPEQIRRTSLSNGMKLAGGPSALHRALAGNANQGQVVSIDGSVDGLEPPTTMHPRRLSHSHPPPGLAGPSSVTKPMKSETELNLSELALALLSEASPSGKNKKSPARPRPAEPQQVMTPDLQTPSSFIPSSPPSVVYSTIPTSVPAPYIAPGSPPLAQRGVAQALQPVLSPISHQTRLKEQYLDPEQIRVPDNSAIELNGAVVSFPAAESADRPPPPLSPSRATTRLRSTIIASSPPSGGIVPELSTESLPAETVVGSVQASFQSMAHSVNGSAASGSGSNVQIGAPPSTAMGAGPALMESVSERADSSPRVVPEASGSAETRVESGNSDWQLKF